MIFITLGSQKFQFNRLLEKIDKMLEAGIIDEVVYAQRGNSTYIPKNYDSIDFLNRDKFGEIMEQSDLVITHAGTGAIIGAVKRNKKAEATNRCLGFFVVYSIGNSKYHPFSKRMSNTRSLLLASPSPSISV